MRSSSSANHFGIHVRRYNNFPLLFLEMFVGIILSRGKVKGQTLFFPFNHLTAIAQNCVIELCDVIFNSIC